MTPTRSAKAGPTLLVRQVKSGIGFAQPQKRTLRALGLGKIGRERILPDNPAIRGMIDAVSHLVQVIDPQDAGESRKE
jgi:large subunit ribosomal protein L30